MLRHAVAFIAIALLSACGGGGGSSAVPGTPKPATSPSTSPTITPTTSPTSSPTPPLATLSSFKIAPAQGQPFIGASATASYAMVGDWTQQFTVTPLDQRGQPFTGRLRALTFSTSNSIALKVAADASSATTIDVQAVSLAATPPQLTVSGGGVTSSITLETQQALWVNFESNVGIEAFQVGNPTPLVHLSGVTNPSAIAGDASGNLLVADNPSQTPMTSRFQVIAPGGQAIASRTIASLNDFVADIAVDAYGNCYLAGPFGFFVDTGCSQTAAPHTGVAYMGAIEIDAAGQFWIGDYYTDSYNVYRDGTLSSIAFSVPNAYAGPDSIAFDAQGHAFLAFSAFDGINTHGGQVLVTAPNGKGAPVTTTLTSGNGLIAPFGLTVDASQNLWVANDKDVLEFSAGSYSAVSGNTIVTPSGASAQQVVFLPLH